MRRRTVILLALVIAAATGTSGCLSGGPLTGKPSPAFQVVTSDGVFVNETTYLGKFVILDLMATWCGPCRLEVAHLREIQAIHGDKVVILSIGVDPYETIDDLERFGVEYGADWPYAIDRDGKVKAAMEMRIIPKLVIIDPEGVVVFEREGEVLPAAITRVIDPSLAPSPLLPLATAVAGAALGFLAAFNPYRRLHRDGTGGGPTLAALGILGALAMLAWPFAGLVSTRATYGSLFIGILSLLAAIWWTIRHRGKVKEPLAGTPLQRAGDRAYELAPPFAGALVLALQSAGALAFFAPLFAFLAGAAAAYATRERVPARFHDALGLAGLALAGAGLLAFGARVLFVRG